MSSPTAIAALILALSAGASTEPGTPFCIGDGAPDHVACPCQNHSSSADEVGCLNSLGIGARLRATGTASVSNDTMILLGSQMPWDSAGLYFQGTIEQFGGRGTQFGDGLRCASGTITRLGAKANVGGASRYPADGDLPISLRSTVSPGQVRTYQLCYRNNDAKFCTNGAINLSNGYRVVWEP